jgi:hypothetical protein
MAAHAASLSAELELCSVRGFPDSVEMERRVRLALALGDLGLAVSLLEESQSALGAGIPSRRGELNQIYNRLEQQLRAKHNEEISLNQEKKVQLIGEVVLKYERVIDKLRKQLADAAHKYQITRDPIEEQTFFQQLSAPETESLEQPVRSPLHAATGIARTAKTERSPTARRTPTSPRSPRHRSRFSPLRQPSTVP